MGNFLKGATSLDSQQLIEAARAGDYVAIRMLVTRGVDVNVSDKEITGCTPIQYAAMGGHLEAVKVLVELGADCKATQTYRGKGYGFNARSWAVRFHHDHVVHWLDEQEGRVCSAGAKENLGAKEDGAE